MDKNEINKITEIIIECAIKVHEKLGPGLLESVYEKTLVYELRKRGLKVDEQAAISIKYEDIIFKEGFRGISSVFLGIHQRRRRFSLKGLQILPKNPFRQLKPFNQEISFRINCEFCLPKDQLS